MSQFDTYSSRLTVDEQGRVHKVGRHVLACAASPQVELMQQLMNDQPKHLLAPLAIRAAQGEPLHEVYPLMGATLDKQKHIVQQKINDGEIGARTVLDMMVQVTEAAGYLHERGLVHHDIRPTNIFYDETEGRPILTLFDYNQVRSPYIQTRTAFKLEQGTCTRDCQVRLVH